MVLRIAENLPLAKTHLTQVRIHGLCRLFFSANVRPSPLQKHVRKEVGGFGKKSCVSTGVKKARKHICVTDRHGMTLAVKVALNPNTSNIQPNAYKPLLTKHDLYVYTMFTTLSC